MRTLSSEQISEVNGGSFIGVIGYGTIGFWVGSITGLCMGGVNLIPGAVIGTAIGAYLGTDGPAPAPQIIIMQPGDTLNPA